MDLDSVDRYLADGESPDEERAAPMHPHRVAPWERPIRRTTGTSSWRLLAASQRGRRQRRPRSASPDSPNSREFLDYHDSIVSISARTRLDLRRATSPPVRNVPRLQVVPSSTRKNLNLGNQYHEKES